ncbi:hypothetical protein FH972_022062 [Carpinus fangiana]|uniref:Uncharacterized protein n=1 Tax=Carpinus fangiana TaxID=176857 RepID=A0A5N6KR52_9ROSI|nr:hypothetical protein FH972_022062 [Carpinus fangiana]
MPIAWAAAAAPGDVDVEGCDLDWRGANFWPARKAERKEVKKVGRGVDWGMVVGRAWGGEDGEWVTCGGGRGHKPRQGPWPSTGWCTPALAKSRATRYLNTCGCANGLWWRRGIHTVWSPCPRRAARRVGVATRVGCLVFNGRVQR